MNVNSSLSNTNKSNLPPLEVILKRNSSFESIHKVHAVICDNKGRVLMKAGRSDFQTFIRSALKPFQVIPFVSSGSAERFECMERGLAISCGSHTGTSNHAREAFKILWNAQVDINQLQCPIPTNKKSPLEHNCSGKHAAFLATCQKMGWPLDSYLQGDHPLQQEILRLVGELLGIPSAELIAARDDCGAPTLLLELSQMALLYAHLAGSQQAELEQITRSMVAYPDLVAGNGRFDTELMKRAHGQLISKGGAEGIQCISRLGESMGIAIKVEDGAKRAKHAVALHLLRQLEWLTPSALEELEEEILLLGPGLQLEVKGELRFQTG